MAKSSGNRGSQADRDNRANQLNPNNDAYRKARGIANLPSKTGNPSGRGRGNAAPRGGKGK